MTTMKLPQPIPDRLKDKIALITGAAGNIGFETARWFLSEGAKVALIDIQATALNDALKKLEDSFPSTEITERILTIQADVTDQPDVKRFVTQTAEHFGGLDIAFFCAGISYSSTSILDTDDELWDKIIRVNTRSAFLGIKHAGSVMRDSGKGGSIILASSIAGLRATPGLCAYSSAKYALRGLCQTAAAELGQYQIRVNTVHPCGVNTPMFQATWPPEKMQQMLSTVPLGRWAEVEDVAALVSFLASGDSQFLTGGALKVDGGIVSS
ncbi:short-chain dehydrogenase, putative [Talaromyces stipitatus ATCC 10500]|uniref:Short-chain dehydrogenase, putative n=1 Tax=Talaromyces stipitatus (strain ATCC 10500 / CBS 375.48 / QM 6759 / NRRL 1006) TaxID=441959 RepID=B8MM73_TALSN|nr:short-chain dehydrogenase, putative [Talaromyces stipitatus ATCC 10500]EED13585.1 short-chain dehydrogenase, putative [Talaromyces stipitatus ATCC 10500]